MPPKKKGGKGGKKKGGDGGEPPHDPSWERVSILQMLVACLLGS